MWHGYEWQDGWGWMMGGMMIFWTLVLVAAVVLVAWYVRSRGTGPRGPGSERRDPLDEAKRRYARGELTREQYQQLKRDLAEA